MSNGGSNLFGVVASNPIANIVHIEGGNLNTTSGGVVVGISLGGIGAPGRGRGGVVDEGLLRGQGIEGESNDLETEFGAQAFALWRSDWATYDPVIEEDVVREAKLEGEYIELTASAQIPCQGETCTIEEIKKFTEHPDRAVRLEAEQALWNWFSQNRDW